MQALEELRRIADHLPVAVVAVGGLERHDVYARDIVLKLDLRIFAGDVTGLGVNERLNVFECFLGERIVGADLAGA